MKYIIIYKILFLNYLPCKYYYGLLNDISKSKENMLVKWELNYLFFLNLAINTM